MDAAWNPRPDVRVLLVERAGCHLCQDAHRVLAGVTAASGQEWVSVDVDSSPALLEEFGELVPVVLVDGVPRGHWRLDGARVLAALAERAPDATAGPSGSDGPAAKEGAVIRPWWRRSRGTP